jgi:hypothetical protein
MIPWTPPSSPEPITTLRMSTVHNGFLRVAASSQNYLSNLSSVIGERNSRKDIFASPSQCCRNRLSFQTRFLQTTFPLLECWLFGSWGWGNLHKNPIPPWIELSIVQTVLTAGGGDCPNVKKHVNTGNIFLFSSQIFTQNKT